MLGKQTVYVHHSPGILAVVRIVALMLSEGRRQGEVEQTPSGGKE